MLIVYHVSKGPREMQLVISIFCLIMALLDTSYYFLIIEIGIQDFWNTLSRVICPSESFIVAIPYMLIGKYIADNNRTNTSKYSMITLLILIVVLLAEAEVCKLFTKAIIADVVNPRYEVFILLPVISYMLVKLSINYQIPISNEMSKKLRNMSILIYLFHRLSLILIHKIGMQTEGILCFIVSIVISIVFSVTIIYLSKAVRFVRYLY